MTELQHLVGALAADYLYGRWTPDPTEEHRARTLSMNAGADSGLDGLVGGVITGEAIAQMLRPGPDLASWRLAPVLRVYPAGDSHARALVRDLLDAVAGMHSPAAERYVQPPDSYAHVGQEPALFLAGGITGCPDWQTRAALQLRAAGVSATIMNPRRAVFTEGDLTASRVQIAWEYEHLAQADTIMFWFCSESIQPIALYELGAHAARGAKITVGAHPEYARRLDVVEQLRHARPEVEVHASLADTVRAVAALMMPGTVSVPD